MIDATLIDPNLVQNVQDMLQLALMCCDRPPKALAADIGYSVTAVYGALTGTRSIPTRARRKLSQINFIAATTVALEGTGFLRLFGYQKVDRHIQSMIIRLRQQDKEMSKLLEELPVILLDKNQREDLQDDDIQKVTVTSYGLIDRANATINLIMELEVRYKLNLTRYLQGKEKAACVGAQATLRN